MRLELNALQCEEIFLNLADLTQSLWNEMDKASKVSYAEDLVSKMTRPKFDFVKIFEHEFVDRKEELALFEYQGKGFILVPANEAEIGFDIDSFLPTKEQQDCFDSVKEEFAKPYTLPGLLEFYLTPPRKIKTKTMLVEGIPVAAERGPVDLDDPEVLALIAKGENLEGVKEGELAIHFYAADDYDVWRRRKISHQEVVESLAAQGFRLPTSDEWEYLCAGGTTSLFRWGNEHPMDKYPTDTYKSMGKSRLPKVLPEVEFMEHWELNCFFLSIAQDTYECEIVAEPGIIRGGDGGGAVCGGYGYFLGWLPLATAFIDKSLGERSRNKPVDSWFVRRIVDVVNL